MARRLNTFVHVHVDGVSKVYGPGDKIPGAVAKLITAPDVWEEKEGDDSPTDPPSTTTPSDPPAGGSSEPTPPPAGEIPKKNGSADAWRAYAAAKGFDVDADVKRDEIIAALKSNGIPTE